MRGVRFGNDGLRWHRPFRNCGVLMLAVLISMAGCRRQEDATQRPVAGPANHELRFGMSFEGRMAVRAELSRVTMDAKRAAASIYPKYVSRDQDMLREAREVELVREARRALLERHGLTEEALESIVEEYLRARGVNVR